MPILKRSKLPLKKSVQIQSPSQQPKQKGRKRTIQGTSSPHATPSKSVVKVPVRNVKRKAPAIVVDSDDDDFIQPLPVVHQTPHKRRKTGIHVPILRKTFSPSKGTQTPKVNRGLDFSVSVIFW